ncbi:alkyl sulfatase [Vibrio mediterranei AK1]|uniref:alkyl/aryl-sulfatase n=1 Tax=Vibrio mediterranei TaxID=689 RepID=UPI0001541A41|nr:alkyl sulfatase dimerization domain-containing protein [Vibrio mediterranei]EDL53477.1 alkyl sulfatase [Vibrio mediterranei AK1]
MKKSILAVSVLSIVSAHAFADYESVETYQGKPATSHTIEANNALAKTLPWKDTTAFDRSKRGLIAEFGDHRAGELKNRMAHLDNDEIPASVNPSIWRQAQMNFTSGGLYQVTEGVYQIRGADLSNMTIYKAKTGYIIHDPMVTAETALAGWEFAKKHLPKINGEHNIVGMIYSHTHVDHFGGSRGIYESGDFVEGAPIIAPVDFIREMADENVLAGNAMGRRSAYQYGSELGNDVTGIVDNALGMGLSKGNVTLVAPTQYIEEREETVDIGGLEFHFINMPGAEAPAEIVHYIPEYRTLHTAELTYDGQHNIYTFRGAKVRDSLIWTKYLTELKMRFVDSGLVDSIHAAHSAPVWNDKGNEISDYITLQRDNYGFVHNQSLRLANHGVTINDVGREIDKIIPKTQQNNWASRGYHGSYSHNARAVVNMYLGYYDMNPVNTNPLTTVDKSCTYVNAAGIDTFMKVGQEHFAVGEYQQASQLLNDVVMCNPDNKQARELLADSFEQQGYQSETMAWRNSYLQAAVELRTNQIGEGTKVASADVIANTPTSSFLDFIAVRLNAPKAEALGLEFNMNVVHPDVQETYYVEVSNANMASLEVDEIVKDTDTTLRINKTDLTKVVLGQTTLDELIKSNKAQVEGDANTLKDLASSLDSFKQGFEIMPLAK